MSVKQLAALSVAVLIVSVSLICCVEPNAKIASGASFKTVPTNASNDGTKDQQNPSTIIVETTSPSGVQATQLGTSSNSSKANADAPDIPTTITITTNNTNPAVNQSFTLSGTLKDNTGTPLSGRSITIGRIYPPGSWSKVGTATTDQNGTYTFIRNESVQGTYSYQAVFYGDTYAPSNVYLNNLVVVSDQ